MENPHVHCEKIDDIAQQDSVIHRLHPDVLLYIFQLVRNSRNYDDDDDFDFDFDLATFYYDHLPMGWIAVTHVCRSWRTSALEFPQLWTRIDMSRPEIAHEMFKRAKSAPLQLYSARNFDISHTSIWEIAMQRISRIQELHLTNFDSTELLKILAQDLETPAPLLETIRIVLDVNYDEIDNVFPLPPFLSRRMPSLRCLDFIDLGITSLLTISTLSRLVKLSLLERIGFYIDEALLLSLLATTPELEELSLTGVIVENPSQKNRSAMVDLPKLSSIYIDFWNKDGSTIFKYLRYPLTASVRLCFNDVAIDPMNVAVIFSRFDADEAPIIDNLRMSLHREWAQLCLIATGEDGNTVCDIESRYGTPNPRISAEVCNQFCRSLPLAKVRSLGVYYCQGVSSGDWELLLKPLQQVESLFFSEAETATVAALLGVATMHNFLPKLQKLALLRCTLTQCNDDEDQFVQSVSDLFDQRKQSGQAIEGLELDSCTFDQATMRRLQNLVDVPWTEKWSTVVDSNSALDH